MPLSSPATRTNSDISLPVLAAAGAAASLAITCIGYFYYTSYKSKQPRNTLADIQGNFYATGSDVCRMYQDRIKGKVIMITGTSSGLGAHTAKLLGSHGAFIIMGVRNPKDIAVTDLVQEIKEAGGQAVALPLDLASLESVKQFAQQVGYILPEHALDVLIHNAGVSFLDGTSKDGYQLVWQVNAMAPALLTELLLSNKMMDQHNARVIHISSEMHRFGLLFSGNKSSLVDKYCPPNPKAGSSSHDYALSKACQVLMATELNARSSGNNNKNTTTSNNKKGNRLRSFAIEPGLVHTNIGRHVPNQWALELELWLLGPFFLKSVDQGCSTTVFCAVAPMDDVLGNNNNKNTVLGNKTNDDNTPAAVYYANCQPKQPKAICLDVEEARKLQKLYLECWKEVLG